MSTAGEKTTHTALYTGSVCSMHGSLFSPLLKVHPGQVSCLGMLVRHWRDVPRRFVHAVSLRGNRPSAAPGGSRDLTYVPGHSIPFARALDYGK
jgi:hypothetical protein